MSQAHFLTLFGRTAEVVTQARDVLKIKYPDAFLNYKHLPAPNHELEDCESYNPNPPSFALTLMFTKAGPEHFSSVKGSVNDIYEALGGQKSRGISVITGFIDEKRACGYNGGFAYAIVLG